MVFDSLDSALSIFATMMCVGLWAKLLFARTEATAKKIYAASIIFGFSFFVVVMVFAFQSAYVFAGWHAKLGPLGSGTFTLGVGDVFGSIIEFQNAIRLARVVLMSFNAIAVGL